MHEIIRFKFPTPTEAAGIEDDFALAIFAAECLYGHPRTRMELRYLVSPDGTRCVADIRGPAGAAAVQVFLGLANTRYGEHPLAIERWSGETAPAPILSPST